MTTILFIKDNEYSHYHGQPGSVGFKKLVAKGFTPIAYIFGWNVTMSRFTKTYKVEDTFLADPENPNELSDESVLDLVNICDPTDRYKAAEDEWEVGETVKEDEFYLDTAPYIDENGNYGHAEFAFRKD